MHEWGQNVYVHKNMTVVWGWVILMTREEVMNK